MSQFLHQPDVVVKIMKLLYVLLADHAFLSIDRKLNIIGVFETINAAKFPVTHPKFVVIGSIAPSKNKFKMSVMLSGEDGRPLMGKLNEKEIDLPEGALNKNFNFIIEIINPSFCPLFIDITPRIIPATPNTGGSNNNDITAQTIPIIPCTLPGFFGAASAGTATGT